MYLIRTMQAEMPQYREIKIPSGETEQKQLLRSLMNVRPPMPVSADFLHVQDAYLSEEINQRGIVDSSALPPTRANSRLFLWQGDITRLKIDAIVNAANSSLLGCFQPCHTCIDNIIHSLSGVQLRLACNEIIQAQGHEEATGTAKITAGYNLPCRYVLHTVGPIISRGLQARDCALLARCYQSCLELAVQNGVRSIAFCCISTGVFRFPPARAAAIAVETVSRFLQQEPALRQVIFDVYTDRDLVLYRRLLEAAPPGAGKPAWA